MKAERVTVDRPVEVMRIELDIQDARRIREAIINRRWDYDLTATLVDVIGKAL